MVKLNATGDKARVHEPSTIVVLSQILVVSLDSVYEYAQRAQARCTLLMHGTRSSRGVRYGVRRLALSPGDGVLQYVCRRAEIPCRDVGPGRR